MAPSPFPMPFGGDAEQRAPLFSNEEALALLNKALDANCESDPTGASWVGIETARDFYEAKRTAGELFTKDEVEAMLSDAMGVSKASVWAELGTRSGFGTRIEPTADVLPVWSCKACGYYDMTVDPRNPPPTCPRCYVINP